MVTRPASLLRIVGVGIIALLTAAVILSSINWLHHPQALDAIFLHLIIAWPVTAFGEWLWSFDREWFALQRQRTSKGSPSPAATSFDAYHHGGAQCRASL